MSYFPCDIPFMSDEELKENGINIPKKRITNREKLARMSNWELAEYLCSNYVECYSCVGEELCVFGQGHGNGLRKWLESEAEGDNNEG